MLFNDKSRQTVIDLTGFVAHPTHCPHVRPLPLLPRQLQPLAALLLSSKKETIHTRWTPLSLRAYTAAAFI